MLIIERIPFSAELVSIRNSFLTEQVTKRVHFPLCLKD